MSWPLTGGATLTALPEAALEILCQVAREHRVPDAALLGPGNGAMIAAARRHLFARWHRELRVRMTTIAEWSGRSSSTVSPAIRRYDAIKQRAEAGLPKVTPKVWTVAADAALRRLWLDKATVAEVADAIAPVLPYAPTVKAVERRASTIGLEPKSLYGGAPKAARPRRRRLAVDDPPKPPPIAPAVRCAYARYDMDPASPLPACRPDPAQWAADRAILRRPAWGAGAAL
jgi:hypothetical protein